MLNNPKQQKSRKDNYQVDIVNHNLSEGFNQFNQSSQNFKNKNMQEVDLRASELGANYFDLSGCTDNLLQFVKTELDSIGK